MLFQPYIVIYQNVQGHSAVAWPPLCTKSKCFISSQNFFTLWPGKLHMISDRDIYIIQHNDEVLHWTYHWQTPGLSRVKNTMGGTG